MKILKWLMAMLALMTLAACGAGGGNAGTAPFGSGNGSGTGSGSGGGVTGTTSIVLAISKTTIAVGAPATLTATVTTAAGEPASGRVINFSTASGLGSFSAPSALTDAAGKASVQLSPASTTANGADLAVAKLVTAAGTGADTAASPSATIGFQVSGTSNPSAGTPTVAVTLSSTSVTSTAPVTLTAILRDAGGAPVAGQIVKFSTVDGLGTFNVPSALSDANGRVTARLSPATTSTNGADLAVVTATVNGALVTGTAAFSVTSLGAPVVGTPAIALALSTTTVTTSTPASVRATVRDATGAGVAGQVVKFSTVDGLGNFDTTSALTDATGTANVTLSAKTAGVSGADQVVASTTVNGTALQASQGFQLTAPNVSVARFTSDVGSGVLSAYGQANLTVELAAAPAGTPVSVSVSSSCIAKGRAALTPSTVSTTTGSATFTYRDQGCGATDLSDTLQAAVAGNASTTPLRLSLASPAVASINFISATPTTIYLKGSGYVETSSVVFRVLDTAGNGLPGRSVLLEPSTLAGGLTLDGGSAAVSKLSDNLGNVNVTINSGTVPTPVRVKATLEGMAISTVSSNLSIAVGLPSQLNFSLSQQTFNIEGFDIDGTPNTYSVIASDRLGNPVPAGTAINFVAEGGQIEPSKFVALSNGLARTSANFVSGSPRPLDGRVTILAYAIGEESFLDINGNNIYDRRAGSQERDEDFQDLGSVYLDRLFNGTYESATDQFISLSLPGVSASSECAASSSLLLEGDKSIPSVPKTCDGVWGRAYVRRAGETVLSTSVARVFWASAAELIAEQNTDKDADVNQKKHCAATTLEIEAEALPPALTKTVTLYQLNSKMTRHVSRRSGTLSLVLTDNNQKRRNPVAAGSIIEVSATNGLAASVVGGSPVPSTLESTFVSVQYDFAGGSEEGTITLKIRSPSGVTTAIPLNLAVVASVPSRPLPAGTVSCP